MRLTIYLPLPAGATWDVSTVPCMIEQLRMRAAGAVKNEWQQAVEFQGVMVAELHATGAEPLIVEPLIDNLIADPLMLQPDSQVQGGELSEHARAVLRQWSDSVRESQVIPVLRFDISGSLVRKDTNQTVGEVYASQAPAIGLAHVDDYVRIG